MKRLFNLCIIFLLCMSVYSQPEMSSGAICAYKASIGLDYVAYDVNSRGFITNKIELYKTYNIDINTFELNTVTNESVEFICVNGAIMKINSNTEFRIDSMNIYLKSIPAYPSRIDVDSYTMNVALTSGDAYFIVPQNNIKDQFILQTPISNLELEVGEYYVQTFDNSVLIYILKGTLGVYDNVTNRKEIIDGGNIVLIHPSPILSPKHIAIFGNRKMTSVKKANSDLFKPYTDVVDNMSDITNNIVFITVGTNITAVKL